MKTSLAAINLAYSRLRQLFQKGLSSLAAR